MKTLLKEWLPPALIRLIRRAGRSNVFWKGDYAAWEDAQKLASGYDSPEILEKVRSSLLKVKNGEAVYERDSVIFDRIQYSWPLLASLMHVAAVNEGVLNLIDFGGSLGSTYYQNRKFLEDLKEVRWNIVEQKHFVEAGKKDFEDGRLRFYESVDQCIQTEKPSAMLFSNVLQYLKDPYGFLDSVLPYGFRYIIIDQTMFSKEGRERITLQTVPSSIYKASYPCWFLNIDKLKDYFHRKGYILTEEFDSHFPPGPDYYFSGFLFRKKTDEKLKILNN